MWAVLFTDLVGSTEQRSRLGDRRGDDLRRAHDAVVARYALDHSGEVVKGTGDGAMVVFDSAADALAAAVLVPQGVELWNREKGDLAEHRPLVLWENAAVVRCDYARQGRRRIVAVTA